jgi:hypothetical protein
LKYIIESNNNPMDIGIELESFIPNNTVKTVVYNAETKDLILERYDLISGREKKVLKLPFTSRKIIVESFSKKHGRQSLGKDQTFKLNATSLMPLKRTKVNMTSGDREYIKWVTQMMVELPLLKADGKLRRSPSGKYKIVIQDKLRDQNGKVLNSPAMIGKKTGTIEIGKDYMMSMSINQRIAILSHEYGHFYKNPLMNLPIGDEFGADLNGVTVFVGSGFGLDEYGNAFKKVFNGANTDQNRRRKEVIAKFLKDLENGKYFTPPYKA